jgi:hypothetical protein
MQLKDLPRGRFKAIYEGTTDSNPEILKTLKKSPPFPLALLRNIEFKNEIVEGHCWYPAWGSFEVAEIAVGDKVQFLATPRYYATSDGLWWQAGLSEVCWVQKDGSQFDVMPVFAPPQDRLATQEFLADRMVVPTHFSEIRIFEWGEDYCQIVLNLLEEGWAGFSGWDSGHFASIFKDLEDRYPSRKVTQMADIAALCNAGPPAGSLRFGGGQYKVCSAGEIANA